MKTEGDDSDMLACRRSYCNYFQHGDGTTTSRYDHRFGGPIYQQGHGIGAVFGTLARLAFPVVRLLAPHLASAIGKAVTHRFARKRRKPTTRRGRTVVVNKQRPQYGGGRRRGRVGKRPKRNIRKRINRRRKGTRSIRLNKRGRRTRRRRRRTKRSHTVIGRDIFG